MSSSVTSRLSPQIFDVRSRHPELFGDLPATFTNIRDVISRGQSLVVPPSVTGPLDVNVDVDLLFLGELHTIGKIVKAVRCHFWPLFYSTHPDSSPAMSCHDDLAFGCSRIQDY